MSHPTNEPMGELNEKESDGVYRAGTGTHGVRFLRIRSDLAGDWRRWTLDDGKTIVFKKV
jgi:hypothetical protein